MYRQRLIRTIEQRVAAFNAAPNWTTYGELCRLHERLICMYAPPINGKPLDVLRALWAAVCNGPFLIVGTTRDGFIADVAAAIAAGTRIPYVDRVGVHPPTATITAIAVSGEGECVCLDLADDPIGAVMQTNAELVERMWPVLHALRTAPGPQA